MYDHREKSKFSAEDCENAVGKKVTLPLTATVIEARSSDEGPFVLVQVDERWGMGKYILGFDLDAFEEYQGK